MMSARTLIHLFRSLNPEMLQKKFRVSVSCVLHSLKTDVLKSDENWSQYPLEEVESSLCSSSACYLWTWCAIHFSLVQIHVTHG